MTTPSVSRTTASRAGAALFVLSTILVGGLASIRLWHAQLAYFVAPIDRIIVIVTTAEILVYAAVMLWQFDGSLPGWKVILGIVIGLAARAAQSAVAAVLGSPRAATAFHQAFLHYYAEYPAAAVMQLALTVLMLWLIKDTFAVTRVLLLPQPNADHRPEADSAKPDAKRRQELVALLMDLDGDQQADNGRPAAKAASEADTPPTNGAPEQASPAAASSEGAHDRSAQVAQADDADDTGPGPDPSPADEKSPAQSPAADAGPSETDMPPKDDPQQSTEAPQPSRQAVGTEPEAEPEHHPPQQPQLLPGFESAADPAAQHDTDREPPGRPAPGDAPQSRHGMFTYQVGAGKADTANDSAATPPPRAIETQLADAVRYGASSLGLADARADYSSSGRPIALAAPRCDHMTALLPLTERLVCTGSSLCHSAGLGSLQKVVIYFADRCIGGILAPNPEHAAFSMLVPPAETDPAILDLALAKTAEALSELNLPPWPECPDYDLVPAFHDAELQNRLQPVLNRISHGAGLQPVPFSVGGMQVLLLNGQQENAIELATALAATFHACSDIGPQFELPECNCAIWVGQRGAIASATAELAKQHLLVCLVRSKHTAVAPMHTRIHRILRDLKQSEVDDN